VANVSISVAIVLEIIIAFLINFFSDSDFDIFSKRNILLIIVFVFLVLLLIVCNIIQHNTSRHTRNKKLQKAFQEIGGYETVAEEVKTCIKQRDLKSMKDLMKILELVEK